MRLVGDIMGIYSAVENHQSLVETKLPTPRFLWQGRHVWGDGMGVQGTWGCSQGYKLISSW